MFIWDFVAETVLGQIVDWFYGQVIGFLGNFFAEMGNMGADLLFLRTRQVECKSDHEGRFCAIL